MQNFRLGGSQGAKREKKIDIYRQKDKLRSKFAARPRFRAEILKAKLLYELICPSLRYTQSFSMILKVRFTSI